MVFQVRDFFLQHVLRFVAQKLASPRTDERVAFLEIYHQNQIREVF